MKRWRRLKHITLATAIVFIIASCVTINIYFPAAAVERVADEIVEEVWGLQQPDTESEGATESPQSLLNEIKKYSFLKFGVARAVAAESAPQADINVSTPAIRSLKRSIKQRASFIQSYLDRGAVGITKDGFLLARDLSDLNLKEKARLKRLLGSENRDRATLYGEINAANGFDPSSINDVRRLFAKSWIKNARPGWWIEADDGSWSKR